MGAMECTQIAVRILRIYSNIQEYTTNFNSRLHAAFPGSSVTRV